MKAPTRETILAQIARDQQPVTREEILARMAEPEGATVASVLEGRICRALLVALDDLDAARDKRDIWADRCLNETSLRLAAEAANTALTARNEALVGALDAAPIPSKFGAGLGEYIRLCEEIYRWRDEARAAIRANAGEG